jgi:hypothetical protein
MLIEMRLAGNHLETGREQICALYHLNNARLPQPKTPRRVDGMRLSFIVRFFTRQNDKK